MRFMTFLCSLLVASAGLAAEATVTAVPGGFEVTYSVNLPVGTSNGNDIVDVVILEWDQVGQIHADLPFTVAGQGVTSLSHVVGFRPVSALVLGYGLGIAGVGDEKDHVFSFNSSSFAAANTGLNWSEAFPGVTPDTRVRHSALIELLRQAGDGDGAALAALIEFARTEGARAAFDPSGPFRVMEWTFGAPIDPPIDYGDAPASYGTLAADNGARHDLDRNVFVYLGACVDYEVDGQPVVAGNPADGDDTGAGGGSVGSCAGPDDEDGVVFGPLTQCAPSTATVTASQATLLDAWIDYDGNGTFDADEQIATSLALAGGGNAVNFDVPCDAVTSLTYSRFRVSTAGGTGPLGSALDGEVEDHSVTIAANEVTATKTSTFDPMLHDMDNNGVLSPGDELLYTIVLTNSGTGDATGIQFADTPDANTTLVAGSVTTTQGTVTTGNTGGDMGVGVDVGTLSANGGTATITFRVAVNTPLAAGVLEIVNQGAVVGDAIVLLATDDPDLPGTDDPTVDALVRSDLAAVPTLGVWGLLLLSVALSLVALRHVGR